MTHSSCSINITFLSYRFFIFFPMLFSFLQTLKNIVSIFLVILLFIEGWYGLSFRISIYFWIQILVQSLSVCRPQVTKLLRALIFSPLTWESFFLKKYNKHRHCSCFWYPASCLLSPSLVSAVALVLQELTLILSVPTLSCASLLFRF